MVGVLTVSVLPFVNEMLQQYYGMQGNGWNAELSLPVLGGYLIYPILGYWASIHDFSKTERYVCYVAAVFCVLLRYTGLRTLSVRDNTTNQLYMNYLGFPALFLALGVFVFFRYLCMDRIVISERVRQSLEKISSCSFGIYLLHILVINKMAKIPFFAKYSVQWYFFWPFICYLICLVIVFFVKRIPAIRWIFP